MERKIDTQTVANNKQREKDKDKDGQRQRRTWKNSKKERKR